jgi:hypothetical protein
LGILVEPGSAQSPSESLLPPPALFGFEDPEFESGSIDGQRGWQVDQGVVRIESGVGWNGSAALTVHPSEPFSQGRLTYEWTTPPESELFLDFRVKLPAAEWQVLEETFDIDSARIGLFRTTDDPSLAEWHVFHGNGDGEGVWLNTGVAATLDPLTEGTTQWTRLTIREDLADQTWSIWVDGALAAARIGFQFPPEAGQTQFYVLGDLQRPVILDDLHLSPSSPPGLSGLDATPPGPDTGEGQPPDILPDPNADPPLDSDADGLPDSWEVAHGLNATDPSDAVSDVDGDGLTALDEFLLGSDAGRKDVRRAVVSQTAEVFNRFAGVSARRAVVTAP